MSKCLFCYTDTDGADFHPKCSKKLFGSPEPPLFDYTKDQMLELAKEVVKSQVTVPGVQPKLSLDIIGEKHGSKSKRLTILGVHGNFILKPPSDHYDQLPELEDLTMHMAEIAGIKTVPHSLIRLQSGELAYITKRVDRRKKAKVPMEDMCQITGRMTEAKYQGSYEQIGKAIARHSSQPGIDLINFFELVLFSFITGNSDMHLKNFSLLGDVGKDIALSPAYDLVPSLLINTSDTDELALTIDGRKNNIRLTHFKAAFDTFRLQDRVFDNILARFKKVVPKLIDFADQGFASADIVEKYQIMINEKANRLELD